MAGSEDAVEGMARLRLVQLVMGSMAAQVVGVAARMKVADALGDREHSADELADACGASPQAMNRLLRAMAALELVTEGRIDLLTGDAVDIVLSARIPLYLTDDPRIDGTRGPLHEPHDNDSTSPDLARPHHGTGVKKR